MPLCTFLQKYIKKTYSTYIAYINTIVAVKHQQLLFFFTKNDYRGRLLIIKCLFSRSSSKRFLNNIIFKFDFIAALANLCTK